MKLILEGIGILLVVFFALLVFMPQDWLMALRIRSAKKSLAEGKQVLATLETAIAEVKGRIAQKPELTETFAPLLKSLEAQQKSLAVAVDRFTEKLTFIEELRKVVRSKPYSQEEANAAILQLGGTTDNRKIDEFLAQLNGDDKNKNGNG